MAHILCLTTGLTGILNSSFELMNRLVQMGHTVKCGTINTAREKVEAQGFDYLQLPLFKTPDTISEKQKPGAVVKLLRLASKILRYRATRKKALEEFELDRFRALLKEEQPDLILIDVELHAFIFTIHQEGIKFLLLSQWFTQERRPELPPLDALFIPSSPKESQAQIQLLWEQRIQTLQKHHRNSQLRSAFTDQRSILLFLAQKLGFPKEYLAFYSWPPPFSYQRLPIIHLNLKELEFPHANTPNHHYLGPMIYEARAEIELNPLDQELLNDILTLKQQKHKKLIYLTSTTMDSEDDNFIQKFIAAVATRQDWIGIISLGGKKHLQNTIAPPENVFLFDFIPQLFLLQYTDCVVNHAGIHTLNECIYFEIPMVIYSGNQHDQNGCASRMAYHQVAVLGERKVDSAKQIEEKIEQAMTNESMRQNIKKMSTLIKASDNREKLNILIDSTLSRV